MGAIIELGTHTFIFSRKTQIVTDSLLVHIGFPTDRIAALQLDCGENLESQWDDLHFYLNCLQEENIVEDRILPTHRGSHGKI